jgi:hypothetical protein
MEQRHVAEHCGSTSAETRQCLRECMQRAMEGLSSKKWKMQIEVRSHIPRAYPTTHQLFFPQ